AGPEPRIRLREAPPWSPAPADELERLSGELRLLGTQAGDEETETETARLAVRCEERASALRSLLSPDDETVTWLERSRGGWELKRVPVEAAPLLRPTLFRPEVPATLTSATLSAGGDFSGIRARLGAGEAGEIAVGSPFDFATQAVLVLDRAIPPPTDTSAWEDALPARILRALHRSNGRALVLFTSTATMKRTHARVEPAWEGPILLQGAGLPRDRMIAAMKDAPGTVIFGVESFWHGVDVPGESLENVIITRLPFPNPGDPLSEARRERVEARGGNAFRELDLPEAILKFRQGFGRLIRTRTDRGIVVVLDSRILSKSYGKRFLASVPACPVEIEDG
ncbi:MAG: hypothetical protein HUU15_12840, partial [Candidatus Brocadiae bacterium]|nr:hypothetical protein [Candidatus Brocadiia bacterium]